MIQKPTQVLVGGAVADCRESVRAAIGGSGEVLAGNFEPTDDWWL